MLWTLDGDSRKDDLLEKDGFLLHALFSLFFSLGKFSFLDMIPNVSQILDLFAEFKKKDIE